MNVHLMIRLMRPRLFAQIAAGASPQDAVDLASNPLVLQDYQYDQLTKILSADGWEKELFGDVQLTEGQRTWLNEFRRLFLEPDAK